MDINWSRTRTKRIASNTEPELGSLAEEREPERESEQLSDREYWQQEKEKAIWNLLIFFAAVVIVAIAVGTAAWFASNREVSGNNMAVVAKDTSGFELEVRGGSYENASVFDGNSIFADEFLNGIQQKDELGNGVNIYRTSSSTTSIIWRKNTTGTYSAGLEPDAGGTLEFYVVPQRDGVLNVKFNLRIRGFIKTIDNEENINIVEITDDLEATEQSGISALRLTNSKKALDYVNGHILFFKNCNNGKYSGFCGTDAIDFNDFIEGEDKSVTADTPVEVTLYWKWANTVTSMMLDSSSKYCTEPLFEDGSEDIEKVILYLRDASTNKVFDGMDSSEINSAFDLLEDDNTGNDYDSLVDLTNSYDNADQIIGHNLDYILIELTATEGVQD